MSLSKVYTEKELKAMGMDDNQIKAIMNVFSGEAEEAEVEEDKADVEVPVSEKDNIMHLHHDVDVHTDAGVSLVPTKIEHIATYKSGTIVELPPFGEGQPFVARMTRPSMLTLVKSGKIPNSLINQATSLFANGTNALNSGRSSTNISEMFEIIDVIVDAALLEPTYQEIRSVGMELTDDQLMAIFSYAQMGVKALERFRTK